MSLNAADKVRITFVFSENSRTTGTVFPGGTVSVESSERGAASETTEMLC